jgi:hypothetical protein
LLIAGCGNLESRRGGDLAAPGLEVAQLIEPSASPLPLRIPIKGVMAGIVDFSAYGIFETATSEMPLTDDDWIAAGLASINLMGATTLVTSPGTGPQDAEWVAQPEWRRWASEMQYASVDAGIAIRQKSRPSYLAAANRLADACRSCHDQYRPEAPVRGATMLADSRQ